jgi:hypothetical protein
MSRTGTMQSAPRRTLWERWGLSIGKMGLPRWKITIFHGKITIFHGKIHYFYGDFP